MQCYFFPFNFKKIIYNSLTKVIYFFLNIIWFLFTTVERMIETGECQNLYVRQKTAEVKNAVNTWYNEN
jgi:hypothetical protein